jgi:ribonuclease HI
MPNKQSDDPVQQTQPVTLIDLLQALQRSRDLRNLARECGLSVRDLKRRLENWCREMKQQQKQGPSTVTETTGAGESEPAADDRWPELAPAAQVRGNPLPQGGSRILEAWTDGASRGNPGPAAIGIVFRQKNGEALCAHSEVIGRTTNNVAEYRAAVKALEFCNQWRIEQLDLYLDSELIARQLTGAYQVKSPVLRPLYQRAAYLARQLKSFRVKHVRRERNGHADWLANQALAAAARQRR